MNAHRAKAVMVLGTGSGVGKSFVAAGLCRILSDAGFKVAPFKAQNMSNNSFVTREGGEMGRAQVVQAECARVEPSVHMNPVLLKPSADDGSQVVIQGKAIGSMHARSYYAMREKIWQAIENSYERLVREYEVLVIEGAGSPAEVNLKEFDLVNLRMAERSDATCLLVGDIDRGGVFAWLWGTLALLEESERERIGGFIINKFRGDVTLLEPGLRTLETLSGKKVLGVLPYELDLWLEEEDALAYDRYRGSGSAADLDIAVTLLPRISNATDFQILAEEPGISVRMVRRIEELGSPDLLILPGTKATMADLQYLKERGFASRIREFARSGGRVLGICGGFQMLGQEIEDPERVESDKLQENGLGLLPIRTCFAAEKTLRRVEGRVRGPIFSEPVEAKLEGYEIHMGETAWGEGVRPWLELCKLGDSAGGWPEGAVSPDGRILGTYVHGLFDAAEFRSAFFTALRKSVGKKKILSENTAPSMAVFKEKNYIRLADLLRKHLDLGFLETCLNLSLHSS